MRLDASQLSKIVHNALYHSFDGNGGLHIHRFTEEQRRIYGEENPDWVVRNIATASVTLDFITDSDHLALCYEVSPGSGTGWGSIDMCVDGVFHDSRYIQDLGMTLAGFELPAGEHRITVYLPWSMCMVIKEVHLSEGATVKPVEKKCKLLCFGDSITQGYSARFASLSYVNQVAAALDAEVINQGVGGYYFNAETLDESLLAYQPDIITVAYGTNDYSHKDTLEEYAERSGKFIAKLAAMYPDTKIVGILPIYRNDANHRVRKMFRTYTLDEARQVLREQYEACPNGYVLDETGIPHIPEAYFPDLLHPNDLGFTVMAQGVIRKLREIM